jgi:hypothetical protein
MIEPLCYFSAPRPLRVACGSRRGRRRLSRASADIRRGFLRFGRVRRPENPSLMSISPAFPPRRRAERRARHRRQRRERRRRRARRAAHTSLPLFRRTRTGPDARGASYDAGPQNRTPGKLPGVSRLSASPRKAYPTASLPPKKARSPASSVRSRCSGIHDAKWLPITTPGIEPARREASSG